MTEDTYEVLLKDDCQLIEELQETGCDLFTAISLYPSLNERLAKAQIFYLTSGIFDDSYEKYRRYVTNHPETKIWTILVDYTETEELLDVVDSLMKVVDDDQTFTTYKLILNHPKLIALMGDAEGGLRIWEKMLKTGDSFAITSLQETSYAQYQFVRYFLKKNKEARDVFVAAIAKILNANIPKINLDTTSYADDLMSDFQLARLYGLVSQFFHRGPISAAKIESDYITSKNCPINWFDKVDDDDKDYSFQTKLFFIAVDFHRIFLAPVFYRNNTWSHIKKDLDNMMKPYIAMKIPAPKDLRSEYDFVNRVIAEDSQVVESVPIINWAFQLYDVTCRWINEQQPEILLDPILDDMTSILKNMVPGDEEVEKKAAGEMTRLAVCVTAGQHTNNTELRKKFLKLATNYLDFLDLTEENVSLLMGGIVDILLCLDRMEAVFLYKFQKKISILATLDALCFEVKKKKVFTDKLDLQFWINKDKTQRFAHTILRDINELCEFISELVPSLGKNRIAINLGKIEHLVYDLLIQLTTMAKFLDKLTGLTGFYNVISSDELVPTVATTVNGLVKLVVEELELSVDFVTEEYQQKRKQSVNLIEFLVTINSLLLKIGKNKNLYNEMVKETLIYKEEIYETVSALIDDYTLIQRLQNVENEDEDEHIPDQFLDPLTDLPIKKPVLLPSMKNVADKLFIDRSTIVRHLLNREENPFNRDHLTITELDEYNKRPDIKLETDKFLQEYQKWKESSG